MIRALILDLDNTLIDFVRLKENAIDAGLAGMAEAGLKINKDTSRRRIMEIYQDKVSMSGTTAVMPCATSNST